MCGNGGSAADASHFATELVVRFTKDRRALPAICLASDSGILHRRRKRLWIRQNFRASGGGVRLNRADVLISFTTSGNSKNVLLALEQARARKLKTITFLGRDGGSTKGMADIDLLVKHDSTAGSRKRTSF